MKHKIILLLTLITSLILFACSFYEKNWQAAIAWGLLSIRSIYSYYERCQDCAYSMKNGHQC